MTGETGGWTGNSDDGPKNSWSEEDQKVHLRTPAGTTHSTCQACNQRQRPGGCPSIHLSVCQSSIYQSFYPSGHTSIHPPVCPSIHPSPHHKRRRKGSVDFRDNGMRKRRERKISSFLETMEERGVEEENRKRKKTF